MLASCRVSFVHPLVAIAILSLTFDWLPIAFFCVCVFMFFVCRSQFGVYFYPFSHFHCNYTTHALPALCISTYGRYECPTNAHSRCEPNLKCVFCWMERQTAKCIVENGFSFRIYVKFYPLLDRRKKVNGTYCDQEHMSYVEKVTLVTMQSGDKVRLQFSSKCFRR